MSWRTPPIPLWAVRSLPLALDAPPGACCSNTGSTGGRPFRGVGHVMKMLFGGPPRGGEALSAVSRRRSYFKGGSRCLVHAGAR
jgi:hypothetical protein